MPTIEIFTAPNCIYCERAKALLAERGLAFVERDIASGTENLAMLRRRLPRARSIPQIFIEGEHIGGYEDLALLDGRGELASAVSG